MPTPIADRKDALFSPRFAELSVSGIVLFTIAGLVLTGTILRIGTFRPTQLFPESFYNSVWNFHADLAVTRLPLVLLFLVPVSAGEGRARPLIAFGYLASTLLEQAYSLNGSVTLLRASALFATCSTALFAWRIVWPLKSLTARIVLMVALLRSDLWVSSLSALLGLHGDFLMPAALAAITLPILTNNRSSDAPVKTILVYDVSIFLAATKGFWALLVFPEIVAGLMLGAMLMRGTSQIEDAWRRWGRRCEVMFFVEGVLVCAALRMIGMDIYVADTMFHVSAVHLEALVILFALLQAMTRASRSVFGWIGLALAFAGGELLVGGMLVLGARGMPKRYMSALDQFAPFLAATSIGAFILFVGLAAVLFSHLGASRADAETVPTAPAVSDSTV